MGPNVLDVDNLIKQFLCCTPINKITLSAPVHCSDCSIDVESQKQILERTVNNNLIKQYPVKHSYQKAFLKWLMNEIEERGEEMHDDMYSTYCKLIASTVDESTHYRHFLLENGLLDYITIQESTSIISQGTTGLCSWQGAIGLNKWCAENETQLRGKTVLELGCGVGLTGLNVTSTCSPKEYIFSDCHAGVLAMVCENVKLNLLRHRQEARLEPAVTNDRVKLQLTYNNTIVKVIELKWEEIDKYIGEGSTIPDIIIAADILYDSESFPALVSGLKILLSSNDTYCVIAATIRNADTVSEFLNELGNHNLAFEEYASPEQTVCIQVLNSPVRILKIFKK